MKQRRFPGIFEPPSPVWGRYAVLLAVFVVPLLTYYGIRMLGDEDLWLKQKYLFLPTSKCADGSVSWDARNVRIRVGRSGEIAIKTNVMSQAFLSGLLEKTVQVYGSSVPVVIETDARTEWRHIQPVLKITDSCGLWHSRFAVRTIDGFPSCTAPVAIIGGSVRVGVSTNHPLQMILLSTNDSRANGARIRPTLAGSLGAQGDALLIRCASNITMQTLVDALDALTIAKWQGYKTVPALVVSEDLLATMTATNPPGSPE
ncbi:MAG: hypothetical protein C0404_03460 [Verrucomicrobia bacterium]|nr:hypothetical protein [Verrucomicrobiota bacterium]